MSPDSLGGSPKDIEYQALSLRHCTTDEHCRSLWQDRHLPFWWYQSFSRTGRNFSLPFLDSRARWWYQVRPGFAWPTEALEPISHRGLRVPIHKSFLGYQHVVPPEEPSNSRLVINTVLDLQKYSVHSLDDKRRNAIRKGARLCEVIMVQNIDESWLRGVRIAWNDLVARTGWKTPRGENEIRESWLRLLQTPATSILLALDRASGQVAGFLITKIYGGTAYVDTIASNSDLLKSNPNDILMWHFIRNAQRLPGVRHVHYAIKSNIEPLEQFKTSLGFEPHPFNACFTARSGLGTMLRVFKPQTYRRLMGMF